MWSRIHEGIICLWYSYSFYSREKKDQLFLHDSRAGCQELQIRSIVYLKTCEQQLSDSPGSPARSPVFFKGCWHWNTLFTVQLQKIRAKCNNVETVGFGQLLLAIALERYNQALHYLGLQNCYQWKQDVGLCGSIRSTLSIFLPSISVSFTWISRSWLHTLEPCGARWMWALLSDFGKVWIWIIIWLWFLSWKCFNGKKFSFLEFGSMVISQDFFFS